MAKYFPLYVVEKMREQEDTHSFLQKFSEHGLVPAEYTFDSFVDYVFSRAFFSPDYIGMYQVLNNFILYDKASNKKFMPNYALKDLDSRRTEWRDFLGTNAAVEIWEKYKIVYKIDNDFFHELKDTENQKFTKEDLIRLPAQAFYIDLSAVDDIEPFQGSWVYIHADGDYITLAVYMVTDDITFFSYYADFDFSQTKEIPIRKDTLPKKDFIARNFDPNFHPVERKIHSKDSRQDIISAVTQIVLFLSVKASDITESPLTKNTYRPSQTIKNRWSELQIWDMGIRYGQAIRIGKQKMQEYLEKADEESSDNTEEKRKKPRKPVRPHVRSAHWQRYHVGKGRKETILEWIPPVYVCGGREIAVTIREIKR